MTPSGHCKGPWTRQNQCLKQPRLMDHQVDDWVCCVDSEEIN